MQQMAIDPARDPVVWNRKSERRGGAAINLNHVKITYRSRDVVTGMDRYSVFEVLTDRRAT